MKTSGAVGDEDADFVKMMPSPLQYLTVGVPSRDDGLDDEVVVFQVHPEPCVFLVQRLRARESIEVRVKVAVNRPERGALASGADLPGTLAQGQVQLASLRQICKIDELMALKRLPHYWSFVRGIHRGPLDPSHKVPVMWCFVYILC